MSSKLVEVSGFWYSVVVTVVVVVVKADGVFVVVVDGVLIEAVAEMIVSVDEDCFSWDYIAWEYFVD